MTSSIKRAKAPIPTPDRKPEPFNPYGICPGLVRARRDVFQSEISMHELAANLPSASKRHSATARLACAYENYLQTNTESSVKSSTFPSRRIQSTGRTNDRKNTGDFGLQKIESVSDVTLIPLKENTSAKSIENSFSTSDVNLENKLIDQKKDVSFSTAKTLFENFFRAGYRPIQSPIRFPRKTPTHSPQPINPVRTVNTHNAFNEFHIPSIETPDNQNNIPLKDNVLYPSIGNKKIPLLTKSSATQKTQKPIYQKRIGINADGVNIPNINETGNFSNKPIVTQTSSFIMEPSPANGMKEVNSNKKDNENPGKSQNNHSVGSAQKINTLNSNMSTHTPAFFQNSIAKASPLDSILDKTTAKDNSSIIRGDHTHDNSKIEDNNAPSFEKCVPEKKVWCSPPILKPLHVSLDRYSAPNTTQNSPRNFDISSVRKVMKSPALLYPYNCGSPAESISLTLNGPDTNKMPARSKSFSFTNEKNDKSPKGVYRSSSGSHPSIINGKPCISSDKLDGIPSVLSNQSNNDAKVNSSSTSSMDAMSITKAKISEALKHHSALTKSNSFSNSQTDRMLPYSFKPHVQSEISSSPAYIPPTPISARKCRPDSEALSHVVDEINKLFANTNAVNASTNLKIKSYARAVSLKNEVGEDKPQTKALEDPPQEISQVVKEPKIDTIPNELDKQKLTQINDNGQAKRGAKPQKRSENFIAAQKAVEKSLKFPIINNRIKDTSEIDELKLKSQPVVKNDDSKPKPPMRSILRPKSVEPITSTRNRISFAPDDKLTTRHDYKTDAVHGHTFSESDVSTSEDDASYNYRKRKTYDSSEDLSDSSGTFDSPFIRRARRYSYPRPQLKPPGGFTSWSGSSIKHFPRLPASELVQERPKSAPMTSAKPYVSKYPVYRPPIQANERVDALSR